INGVGANTNLGNTLVNDGCWHHVAVVKEGTLCYVYVDGSVDRTMPFTNSEDGPGGGGFTIGGLSTGDYFTGDVDEFRFWREARSANDIAANTDQVISLSESGLTVYHDYNDGPGSSIAQDLKYSFDGALDASMDVNSSWIDNYDPTGGCPVVCDENNSPEICTPDNLNVCGNGNVDIECITSGDPISTEGFSYEWFACTGGMGGAMGMGCTPTSQGPIETIEDGVDFGSFFNATSGGMGMGTVYTVIVTDEENGCTASKETVVRKRRRQRPIAIIPEVIPCEGEIFCATAERSGMGMGMGNPIGSYEWSNGEVTNPACRLTAGPISVTLTNQFGCTTISETSVEAAPCEGAMHFSGGPEIVVIPGGEPLFIWDIDFSIEFWVRNSEPASNDLQVVVGSTGGSVGGNLWAGIRSGKIEFAIGGVGANSNLGNTSVNDGCWHHIAVVREAGLCYTYVDGVFDQGAPFANNTNGPAGSGMEVTIGGFNNGNYFTGDVDEVRWWREPRSEADIAINMNQVITDGPTAYYNFDEASGSTVVEDHIWSFDGTLDPSMDVNTAWVDGHDESCVAGPNGTVLMCHTGGMGEPHKHDVDLNDVDDKLATGDYKLGVCPKSMTEMPGKVKYAEVANIESSISINVSNNTNGNGVLISTVGDAENVMVILYNVGGKEIDRSNKRTGERFELRGLEPGMYILKVVHHGGVESTKFVQAN
ncbi:MAG: T9SS type A sorting domain-containing protein, partial [Flavobacteriales bacterium]|nr:T9SS type A sorting domain-containing protein [Flavobacteriales bacterium]